MQTDHPKCRRVQSTDPDSNFNTKVRRDWYAYAVLSALPWVGRELYEKKESELDRMLGSLEGYIKRRNKIHHGALRVFRLDAPHPQEEVRGNLIGTVDIRLLDMSGNRMVNTCLIAKWSDK